MRRQRESTVSKNKEESKARVTNKEMRSLLGACEPTETSETVSTCTSTSRRSNEKHHDSVTQPPTRERDTSCLVCVAWLFLVENILLLLGLWLLHQRNNNAITTTTDSNNITNCNCNKSHAFHDWLDIQTVIHQDNSTSTVNNIKRVEIPQTTKESSVSSQTLPLLTTSTSHSSLVQESIDYVSYIQDPDYSMTNICILQGSGLGSQLLNMLAQKIYFTDRERGFIVDDTQYGYQWHDNTTGVLNGFFAPKFPVLKMGEWDAIVRPRLDLPSMDTLLRMGTRRVHTDTAKKVEIMWAIAQPYRDEFPKTYGRRPIPLYSRFVTEACNNLQFNEQAKLEMKKLLDQHNIPNNLRQYHSVAFHVRRGDKIGTESKLYEGSIYVDKLVEVMTADNNTKPLEHCFIASDDYVAVEEVTESLKQNNINCTIHTLTVASEQGTSSSVRMNGGFAGTLEFLTEISLMVDATFFIGTFNSNVGALVSLLRKCYYVGTPHFANSYGVDKEDWYFHR